MKIVRMSEYKYLKAFVDRRSASASCNAPAPYDISQNSSWTPLATLEIRIRLPSNEYLRDFSDGFEMGSYVRFLVMAMAQKDYYNYYRFDFRSQRPGFLALIENRH